MDAAQWADAMRREAAACVTITPAAMQLAAEHARAERAEAENRQLRERLAVHDPAFEARLRAGA